jgi:protein TonB
VLLNVLVDGEGRVAELHVKNSSGHSSLDRAAVRAVKGWLFTPGLAGGQSVPMWVDVPIIFQLK